MLQTEAWWHADGCRRSFLLVSELLGSEKLSKAEKEQASVGVKDVRGCRTRIQWICCPAEALVPYLTVVRGGIVGSRYR